MAQKKTMLCLAANVTDMDQLLKLANIVGKHICILKVHVDILESFSKTQRDELKNIAKHHNFLIMEDRYVLRSALVVGCWILNRIIFF